MEFNEQAELTSKIETDSYTESIVMAKVRGEGRRQEGLLNKKEKGLMGVDNSMMIVVGKIV